MPLVIKLKLILHVETEALLILIVNVLSLEFWFSCAILRVKNIQLVSAWLRTGASQ